MTFLPRSYFAVLYRRDFFILVLTLFFGQLASSFLILSLISAVFSRTHSDFGVSGVILSLAVPAFFLMAIAGLAADLFDRRKIMIAANIGIALVVLLIILWQKFVFASISLAFLYFAINSFFIPAVSAASGQLVRKDQLLVANSIFIFILDGVPILGFFMAAVVHFFFGSIVTLIIAQIFLVAAVMCPFFLPKLLPNAKRVHSKLERLVEIWQTFIYIFRTRTIWFYFVIFGFVQALIAFGGTLAPGFFDQVVGLTIEKSPLFVLPWIGLGALLGAAFANNPKIGESMLLVIGFGAMGIGGPILGIVERLNLLSGFGLLLPTGVFLFLLGFGAIVVMIAARTVLQKEVSHNFQGTVFGAVTIFAALMTSILSPLAALLAVIVGYVNIIIFGGIGLLAFSWLLSKMARRWKF